MKKFIHKSFAPKGGIISAFILLIGVVVFLVSGHVSATDGSPTDGRLITIHDRGVQSVILTQAATIGDALKEAGITIDESDAVEPALSEKLVASDYQVNIYRARPVIVVDGATRQKIVTPYQTGARIAQDAGITLYDEDKTVLTRTDDIVSEGAGLRLTITRAVPFTFTLYGATTEARTQSKTVEDMLQEKGIKLSKDDRVSVPVATEITSGLVVRVWREGKQTITVDEAVVFSTDTIQDGDQYIGYRAIKTLGQNGSRNVTYEVVIQDGKEVGRTEIASITTQESSKQIEIIGVKRKTANPAENRLLGHQMMLSAGFDESQWTYLDQLWTHESGWDQYKSNYAGSGAYGIPQALPGSKMGAGWQDDPVVQISWGLRYIRDRYGNPYGAFMHWRSENWY